MKSLMTLALLILPLLGGCGTAKTVYAESKYKICEDGCRLKYSKYETQKLYQCLTKCRKRKLEDGSL